MKQELQEAYNLVSSVCAHFSTNLETHTRIQAALKTIHSKLDELPGKANKKK